MKVFFIYNPFTKHPKSVNETYLEHMWCAFKFFYTLLGLSFAALVHSVFPFLFEFTASNGVKKLNSCLQERKLEVEENKSFFLPNDFDLPTHEEIWKAEKEK